MGGCFSKNKYAQRDSKGDNRPRTRRGSTAAYQHYKHPVYYHQKAPQERPYMPPRQQPQPQQQRHAHQVTVKSTQPNIQVIEQDPILGKPFENIKAHYTLGRELGRGQYGVIYLCTENSTGQHYACKSILKRKLVCKKDTEDIKREIQIMQHLSGQPNIVEFKGAYEDQYSVHLVMELCAGGELFDKIIAKGYYSEKNAADIIRQILNVVYICHFMGVMHRDLKPENFLLTRKDEHTMLKATDFGLSVFIEEGKVYYNIVGSSYYVDPKVLRRNYGKEVDVWSASVILYILLSGVLPYWDETVKGIFHAMLK